MPIGRHVPGQLVYPLGKQRHLHLGRACVIFMKLKLVDGFPFFLFVQIVLLYSLTIFSTVKYNISKDNCKFTGLFLALT